MVGVWESGEGEGIFIVASGRRGGGKRKRGRAAREGGMTKRRAIGKWKGGVGAKPAATTKMLVYLVGVFLTKG
jgi:hypothetical protein